MTGQRQVAANTQDQRASGGADVRTHASLLRVALLGGFRVAVGEHELAANTWRLRKAADIVKLLALAPGHALHREQLLEALWPGRDPATGANGLRYALHIARRTLASALGVPDALQWRDGRLALHPACGLWVDVAAFEAAAAAAHRTADPAVSDNALALYAGDLLPEDRYADWAADRRETLRETALELLVAVARQREERGEHEAAIVALGRALAVEPAREETHVALMRLYATTGRRNRALRQYARLRAALRDDLDTEPDPATQALYHAILARRFPTVSVKESNAASSAHRSAHTNLRAPLTSLIGRAGERAAVARLLIALPPEGARLVTLTGTGGCGKTRLALAVAAGLLTRFPDGVWLVELAALRDPAAAPRAVATALGVPEEPGRAPMDGLAAALRDRALLLVLDNCEHLVATCAELAGTLLGACPALRLLTTSREALRVPGERPWRVPSLPVPAPDATWETLSANDAARLFADRVRWHHPDFAVDETNAATVAAICRRLDGLPLALELAAARAAVLTVDELAARLNDTLGVLAGGSRIAPPRQQTLRATLDWSYALLAAPERVLLRRLALFAGGWTLAAAEVVCTEGRNVEGRAGFSDEIFSPSDVLGLLAQLVDKSLVQVDAGGEEARYRLLEPVRQYAAERLAASGEAVTVAARHVAHFLTLAEAAEPELSGPAQRVWLRRLDAARDDLLAALDWSREHGDAALGLRLAGALGGYWFIRGAYREGQRWLDEALALAGDGGDPALHAKALLWASSLAWLQDATRARALAEAGVARARASGNGALTARTLSAVGMALLDQGRVNQGAAYLEQAAALARDAGGVPFVVTLENLWLARCVQGRLWEAQAVAEEGLRLSRSLGFGNGELFLLVLLAATLVLRGDAARARPLAEQALRGFQAEGHTHGMAFALAALAGVAAVVGHAARAARIVGAQQALLDRVDGRLPTAAAQTVETVVGPARRALGEAAWAAARAAGAALPLEQAVAEALAFADEVAASGAALDPSCLSPREREVVALVAHGLTNRQIGAALGIAERTAETHVAHILHKLGLTSRAEIAAWAARTLPTTIAP